MVSFGFTIRNTRNRSRFYDTATSSACDETSTDVHGRIVDIYYFETNTDYGKYDDLIKDIKSKKVYPWELESPILKFNKKTIVHVPMIFNRKLFINAYKSARSTIDKIN